MSAPARSPQPGNVALPAATLRGFKAGDAQAFAQVVRAYGPLVRAAVARYWRGAFDREEAMQEIWMHVFRNRESLDVERAESFSGWLAVLARRRCIDLLRRPADPALAGDADEAKALGWLMTAPEQSAAVEDVELMRAVEAFKAKLGPEWREFFELHFVQGLDYAAAGERLSIGKLRCKYMRKVLAGRARRNAAIMSALGRTRGAGDAP